MNKAMKALAIVALLLTVAGACVVLYGMNTFVPTVEQATVTRTPASEAQEAFDALIAQIDEGTFSGRMFSDAGGLSAEDCVFETCTVRLKNAGFFPAEWITLDVLPMEAADGRDILQIADSGAYVLASGSMGDLSASVLTTIPQENLQRTCRVTCYVFGREITFDVAIPGQETSTGNDV